MELKLEFFDAIGTPLGFRLWQPRDGIVWIPKDAEQLRIANQPMPSTDPQGAGDPSK